jgi:hypothetical protein
MTPARKERSHKHPHRQNLRLVTEAPAHTPQPEPHHRPSARTAVVFVLVSLAVVGVIAHLTTPVTSTLPAPLRSFSTLHETYRKLGMERYLQEKQNLKVSVQRLLGEPAGSNEARAAMNIAVYLFPDLLADEVFERDQAKDLWQRQEEAIEHAPRTPESRLWFEEMRANIWNYENPDRSSPRISEYAEQAIRVFDVMSQTTGK